MPWRCDRRADRPTRRRRWWRDEGRGGCRGGRGLAAGLVGTAAVASALSFLGVGTGPPAATAAAGQIRRPCSPSTRMRRRPAPACPDRSWSLSAPSSPTTAVDPAGGAQRRQQRRRRRAYAVRAGDVRRVRLAGAARRRESAELYDPNRRGLRGGRASCARTVRPVAPTLRALSTPTTTRHPT